MDPVLRLRPLLGWLGLVAGGVAPEAAWALIVSVLFVVGLGGVRPVSGLSGVVEGFRNFADVVFGLPLRLYWMWYDSDRRTRVNDSRGMDI